MENSEISSSSKGPGRCVISEEARGEGATYGTFPPVNEKNLAIELGRAETWVYRKGAERSRGTSWVGDPRAPGQGEKR